MNDPDAEPYVHLRQHKVGTTGHLRFEYLPHVSANRRWSDDKQRSYLELGAVAASIARPESVDFLRDLPGLLSFRINLYDVGDDTPVFDVPPRWAARLPCPPGDPAQDVVVEDLAPIVRCPGLEWLTVEGTKDETVDLAPLAHATALPAVTVQGVGRVRGAACLVDLPYLEQANFWGTREGLSAELSGRLIGTPRRTSSATAHPSTTCVALINLPRVAPSWSGVVEVVHVPVVAVLTWRRRPGAGVPTTGPACRPWMCQHAWEQPFRWGLLLAFGAEAPWELPEPRDGRGPRRAGSPRCGRSGPRRHGPGSLPRTCAPGS